MTLDLSNFQGVCFLPITIEEFDKLPDQSRHDYLRDRALERLRNEGFQNIQKEKETGMDRERGVDIYAEKNGKSVGVEIWTDRELYEKIRDYEKAFDEIIIVIPATKAKLWCMEVPSKYLS